MLVIKLKPIGKKKQISYRIAVMEKKSKLKGKFIEDLGWYNPHTDKFFLMTDRIKYWLSSGAQPSDSIHNILISGKVLEGKKIPLHKKSKQPPVEAAAPEKPAVEEEKPKEEQPKEEQPAE